MNSTIKNLILKIVEFFLTNGFMPRSVILKADITKPGNSSNRLGYVKPSYNDRILTITINYSEDSFDAQSVAQELELLSREISAQRGGEFTGCGWIINRIELVAAVVPQSTVVGYSKL